MSHWRQPLPMRFATRHAGDGLALAAVVLAHASAAAVLAHQGAAVPADRPPQVLQVSWHERGRPHPAPPATPSPKAPAPRHTPPRPPSSRSATVASTAPPLLSAQPTPASESASEVAPPGSTSQIASAAPAPAPTLTGDPTLRPSRSEAAPEQTAPSFRADYLANPAPPYPRLSRELREQGRVLLRVHVASNGQPTEVLLHQSSGFERLDAAALQAVHQWKFVPAKRGSEVIAAWVIVPIEFSLRSHLS